MINLIVTQLMSKVPHHENDWAWTLHPRAWDFFRVEYKSCAREAYEYWTQTKRQDWDKV